MYTVTGVTAATGLVADSAICAMFNPHATHRIKIVQFQIFKNGGAGVVGDAIRMRRITARGTPGSTITPGIQSHSERGVAPVSGVLLDLSAYTVQPTLDLIDLGFGWTAPAVQGAGIVLPIPGGIVIPPGAGLAIIQIAATAWPASNVTFAWLEDWM